MINKITIHELSDAIRISYKENSLGYNAWISAVDEEDRNKISRLKRNFTIGNFNFKYLSHFFYDWSDEDNDIFIVKNIESMGPSKKQIQNIISFIKNELVQSPVAYNLGINCFAGISRSTAIGIIAWVLNGDSPEQALQKILSVRDCAQPNLRILRFASEIIGIDLTTSVKKYIDETKNIIYIGGWNHEL
jgi:predicted protein tyrosine phosphatase